MTHQEIQDLLEDYVDEKLDRETRREVDRHLKTCPECRAILDDVAPVDIGSLGPQRFDEQTMRRTVRRGLYRTAFSAAVMLLAGWIVVWFLSILLFQPLVVNRGGRAVAAIQASIDIPTMINPGASVTGGQIQSGIFEREVEIDLVLPVGSGVRTLGPLSLRFGALNLVGVDQFEPWPYLVETDFLGSAREQLANLGGGTVSTVQLFWTDFMTVAESQAIADETEHDVRVIWAGFDVLSQTGPISWVPGGILGYGTCVGPETFDEELLGATSASFHRSVNQQPTSIQGALTSAKMGLANLLEHPELLAYIHPSDGDSEVSAVAASLERESLVRTLVITGPSDEIASFLDGYSSDEVTGQVLAVDFYDWNSGLCGR